MSGFDTLLTTTSSRALRTYRASTLGAAALNIAAFNAVAQAHTPPEASGGLYPPAGSMPCVVGKRQGMWIDDATEYCHLCKLKMSHGKSFHMGFDRDHVALNAFVFMSVMFPKHWDTRAVHSDAVRHGHGRRGLRLDKLGKFALPGVHAGRSVGMDALNPWPCTPDDYARLADLRALLMHGIEGPSVYRVLTRSPFDESPPGLIGHGEKIFRATVTELVVATLPPLGPNVQAAFSQKAWGRTNLMLLYDRLRLGEFQAAAQLPAKVDRSDKSGVVRQIVTELALAAEGIRDRGVVGATDCSFETDHVAADFARLLLHRIAFEAVYQKSAHYMHQAQQAIAWAGYPSVRQLMEADFV